MKETLKAGVFYVALVFAAGFVTSASSRNAGGKPSLLGHIAT
jgi:hypothetical protein